MSFTITRLTSAAKPSFGLGNDRNENRNQCSPRLLIPTQKLSVVEEYSAATFALLASTSTQACCSLEGIVDPPLQTSEGTDHENTSGKTASHQVPESDLGCYGANRFALVLSLTDLRDNRVSRMGHNCAHDTSSVTRQEGNSELSLLRVRLPWFRKDVSIAKGNGLFEKVELGDCVRDLTAPQRNDGAEWESSFSRIGRHLRQRRSEGGRPGTWRCGLNLDLDHFHRTQSDVSKELCRSGSKAEDEALVLFRVLFSGDVAVHILEVLVETKFEKALHRVADESGQPALPDTGSTLLGDKNPETGEKAVVFLRVDLHVALGDI